MLDGSGNIIVVGHRYSTTLYGDWLVRRYDPALSAVLGSTEYVSPSPSSNEFAYAAAVDASGNLVVVGSEYASPGADNWVIQKYTPDLSNLLSATRYAGPGGNTDHPHAVAVDAGGNIIVAGYEITGATNLNWRIRRYSPDLSVLLGSTDYDGPNGGGDEALGIATDGSGNIVVVGKHVRSGGGVEWHIRRYNASLTALMASTVYGGPLGCISIANDVAVDTGGNVFVVGSECGIGGGYNWRVRKYDASLGVLLAATDYSTPGALDHDVAQSVAAGPGGMVVVAGYEAGSAGGRNWRIRVYDSALSTLLGSTDYDGAAGGTDFIQSLLVEPDGDIVAAGVEAMSVGGDDWLIRKYGFSLTPPPPGLAVSVTLYQTPANPAVGQTMKYTIIVTNTGTVTITAMKVIDSMPFEFEQTAPAQYSGGSFSTIMWAPTIQWWNLGTLLMAPGATYSFSITGRMKPVCAPPVTVGNLVSVEATAGSSTVTVASGPLLFTDTVTGLDLAVTKTLLVSATSTEPGGPVAYRITLANTCGQTVTSLVVTDTLLPVLTGITTAQPAVLGVPVVVSVPGAGTRYVWSSGALTLGPGATYSITITGTFGQVYTPTWVWNVAAVTARSATDAVNRSGYASGFWLNPPAVMHSGMTATPDPVFKGDLVTVILTVTSVGTVNLGGFSVTLYVAATGCGDTGYPPLDICGAGGGCSGFSCWSTAYIAGPSPAVPATLLAGESKTFTWSVVSFGCWGQDYMACVSGTRTDTGTQVLMTPGDGVSFVRYKSSLAVTQNPASAGNSVTVAFTITHVGYSVTLYVPSLEVTSGSGLVGPAAGPQPGTPVLLPDAFSSPASASFAWTLTTLGSGSVQFTASGAGLELSWGYGGLPPPFPGLVPVFNSASATLVIGPPILPPAAPVGLTSATVPYAIELAWGASVAGTYPVSTYEIFRATCAGCAGVQLDSVTAATLTWTDWTAGVFTEYWYTVRAVDTMGYTGSFAGPVSGRIGIAAPVGTKRLLTLNPAPGGTVMYAIDITNRGTYETEYLYVTDTVPAGVTVTGTDQPFALSPSQSSVGGGTLITWFGWPVGLAPGQTFTLTITGTAALSATNLTVCNEAWVEGMEFTYSTGWFAWTNNVCFTLTGPGQPPAAPGNLTAFGLNGPDRIVLGWMAAVPGSYAISAYVIFRATCGACPAFLLATTGAGATTFTDAGVVAGLPYTYTVRAIDTVGVTGGLSAPATATVSVLPVGPPPAWTIGTVASCPPDLAWSRTFANIGGIYNNTWPLGVAVDEAGNWIVAAEHFASGGGTSSWRVRKFAPNGAEVWTWDGASSAPGKDVRAVATDGAGNIYVGGSDAGAGLRKYTPAGGVVWSTTVDAAGGIVFAAAVDPVGNVFVGGRMADGSPMLAKISAAGVVLWSRTTPASIVLGLAATADGEAILALNGGFVQKYTSAGIPVWTQPLGLQVGGVAVDPAGNIFAAGVTPSSLDWVVARFSPAGALVWSRTYNAPTALSADIAQAVRLDAAGRVVVGGTASEVASQSWWLIRVYSAAGDLEWSRTLDRGAAQGLDIDASGRIGMVGTAFDPGGTFTLRVTGEVCASTLTTPPSSPVTLTALGFNGPDRIALGWSAAVPGTYAVSAYEIFRATCGACPVMLLTSVSPASTSYTDFAVQVGVPYTYTVRAVDNTGLAGGFSVPASASVPEAPIAYTAQKWIVGPAPVPGGPITYHIIVANVGAATIQNLSIMDTLPVELYGLASDQPAGFTGFLWPACGTWCATHYSADASGLSMAPGAVYTFTITGFVSLSATDIVCNRAWAVAWNLTPPTWYTDGVPTNLACFSATAFVAAPSAPAALTALGLNGPDRIELGWSAAVPGTYALSAYEIFRATCGGCPASLIALVSPAATTYTDFAVQVGVPYTYTVRAVDILAIAGGFSPPAAASVPVPCSPGWSYRAPMSTARQVLSTAVVGGTLYAIGGYNGGWLDAVEAYSSISDAWWTVAPLAVGRGGIATGSLGATIFAAGGGIFGLPDATFETYNANSGMWSLGPALPTPRYGAGGAVAGGKFYVIGGEDSGGWLGAVEVWDPAVGAWAARAPMPTPRVEPGVGVIGGTIYVVGGFNNGSAVAAVEAYDPATDSWTAKASLPAVRTGLGVAVVGGTLYAIGGDPTDATALAYDPATDSWTPICDLQTGRGYLAAAAVGGTLYALGGHNGTYLASVESLYVGEPPFVPDPPAAPGWLSAICDGNDVTLTWSPSVAGSFGVSAYEIWRATCGGCPSTLLVITGATSYVDAPGVPGGFYEYFVRGVDGYGNTGGWSPGGSVSLPGDQIPPAPGTLTVIPGPGEARLIWTHPDPCVCVVSAYQIWRSTCGGCPKSLHAVVGRSVTIWLDGGLDQNVTYEYEVRAVNTWGTYGTYTNPGVANPRVPPPAVLVTTPEPLAVQLEWTPGGPCTCSVSTYQIWRATCGGCPKTLHIIVGPTVTIWLDSGLDAGGTYEYEVRMEDTNGNVSEPSPGSGAVAGPPSFMIGVTKDLTPAVPAPGGIVAYRITVRNLGSTAVDELTVWDTVPPQITGVATAAPAVLGAPVISQAAPSGTLYVWTATGVNLAQGQTLTITVTGIAGPLAAPATVCNEASAFGKNGPDTDLDAAAPVCFTATPSAQLTYHAVIGVEGVSSATLLATGQWVTVSLTVTNTGSCRADVIVPSLTITGTCSPYLEIIYLPGVCPKLEPGEAFTFSWTYSCSGTGTLDWTYQVRGTEGWSGLTVMPPPRTLPGTTAGRQCTTRTSITLEPGVCRKNKRCRVVCRVINLGDYACDASSATLFIGGDTFIIPGIEGPDIGGPIRIEPGTSTEFAWTFTPTGPGNLCITADALGLGLYGTPVSGTTVFCLAVVEEPAIAVAKEQVTTGGIGSPVTYRIIVSNTGGVTLTDVTVSDTIAPVIMNTATDQPAGFGLPVVAPVVSGTRYVWTGTGLSFQPGTAYTFTITGTVGSACTATDVSNTAFASAADAGGGATAFSNPVAFTVVPDVIGLSAVKVQSPASPGIGEAVRYAIHLTNTGAATLDAVTIVDTVSPVVTAIATEQPPSLGSPVVTAVASGTRYVWSGAAVMLAPGASLTVTLTGRMGPVCAPMAVSNTAYVIGSAGCGVTEAFAASAGAVVQPAVPGLVVALVQTPAAPVVGGPATYAIFVTNTGTATLTTLSVIQTLPPVIGGVTGAQPAPFTLATTSAGTGTRYGWSAAGLAFAPGVTWTFTLTGTVGQPCTALEVSATALVSAADACTATELFTNPAGFALAGPVFGAKLVKTQVPAAPGIGAFIAYEIHFTNTGTAALDTVTIVDTVPAEIVGLATRQPVLLGAPVVVTVAGGTRHVWSASGVTLQPGATISVTVTGRVGLVCVPTLVSNTAYAVGSSGCGSADAFAAPPGTLVQPPVTGLAASLTQSPAIPVAGGPVTYRIVVRNTGTATVATLTVTDTVPLGVLITGSDQPGGFALATTGVPGGTRFEWTGGALSLIPGRTFTFTLTGVAPDSCVSASVFHAGRVTGASACLPAEALTNAAGFTLTGVTLATGVTLRSVPAEPAPGAPVTYRILVVNSGTATITDLLVSDTIPALVGALVTVQPAGFGAPVITAVTGGRRIVWSGAGLTFAPGTVYTLTVTGTVGTVTSDTTLAHRAVVTAGIACAQAGAASLEVSSLVRAPVIPPEPVESGKVKIVGGIRGYINPKRGEQSTILIRPETAGEIVVRIYDQEGVLVWTESLMTTGGHTEVVQWRGVDSAGREMPPGLYPILITAPGIRYRDTLIVVR